MAKHEKHHKFHKMTVEMHKDGSHTSHLHHEEGEHKDVKAAHHDHDALMDHIMDHTAPMNPGEAEADAGQHGVPAPAAAAAGLPAPPQGA